MGSCPSARFLPSPLEYVRIQAGVPRKERAPKDARSSARQRGVTARIASLVAVAVLLLGAGIWYVIGSLKGGKQVEAIYAAKPAELEGLISKLGPYRYWAEPSLAAVANGQDTGPKAEKAAETEAARERRLKASLAMVASDSTQVAYLNQRLVDCSVDEFPVIRNSLKRYQAELRGDLWRTFRNVEADKKQRFYAGMALADYVPADERWTDADADFLAEQLLLFNPEHQGTLRGYLAGVSRPAAAYHDQLWQCRGR